MLACLPLNKQSSIDIIPFIILPSFLPSLSSSYSIFNTSYPVMSTYTIASGDSLWKISQDHGVTLDALRAANPQITNPDLIYPGQQLNIPGSDQSQPPQPESRGIPGDGASHFSPSDPPIHLAVCPPGPPVVPSAAAGGAPPAVPPRPPMARPPPPWINVGRPGYKTVGYFTNWVN